MLPVRTYFPSEEAKAVMWSNVSARFVVFLPTQMINSDGDVLPYNTCFEATPYDIFVSSRVQGIASYVGVYKLEQTYKMNWDTFKGGFPDEVGVTFLTRGWGL